MNLKELIAAFKSEWAKGEQANKETLEDLIADMEPIAARDYKQIKKLEQKAEGKSPEDVLALESKIEELTDQLAKSTRETEKTIRQLTRERDEAVAAADGERKAVTRLTVDNELTDALSKAGIKKELIPAARALLKEQGILEVESEGDVRRAVAKMMADGKEQRIPLGDYITKHFATSEIGKAFIPASGDSGGGAGGVHFAGSAARTLTLAEHQALSPKEQSAFFEGGGKLIE